MDGESLIKDDTRPDSLSEMFIDLFKSMNKKMGIMILIIFIILNTTVFIDSCLSYFTDAVESTGQPTDRGILIQGMLLATLYIIFDVMNQYHVI